MPEIAEIYATLIDDPDVIPPKNVSKEDYALMLAQQRIKQHANNEKALTLGLTKLLKNTNGHSNGHSSNGTGTAVNGHSPSAVNQLSEFLVKYENTKISDKALRALHDKGYSDAAIDRLRVEQTGDTNILTADHVEYLDDAKGEEKVSDEVHKLNQELS